ncbi:MULTISPECIES: hypothetical protein [unclassified Microcoleus]|uniref:hypothetical protein n=1 Tax=unclassified Microcoleus TaxID=2642155 RepID=UPI0025D4A916|nr:MULTISPECIES: hypothetical protein [unclassified Microcoleus]
METRKTGNECQRLDGLIARRQEKNRFQRSKLERTKRLRDEAALGKPLRKSPILDFVDDLVHRPPNQEQMRQLKELLVEEQKAIAQLIALIDRHLE